MAILHLNSSLIIGITCMKCDGSLTTINDKSLVEKFLTAITFGKIKTKTYECKKCRSHFMII